MDIAAAIASVSRFRLHPLGFFYLENASGFGTVQRIHVWLSIEIISRPSNDRHSHSYDIESIIHKGRMLSEVFQFREAPAGGIQEFEVIYGENGSSLSGTGRTGNLIRICSFESVVGSSYMLSAGTIHNVSILERPCVTALKTVDRRQPIYSYGNDNREPPFERRNASDSEISEIEAVLSSILF